MIERAIILSLQITAIYILFQQGMLLGWFRIMMANVIDEKASRLYRKYKLERCDCKGRCKTCAAARHDKAQVFSRYLQKPLWDCLACMSALWTIILTLDFDLKLILVVCGINVIIDKIIE